MDENLRKILAKRRDRMIATILTTKEEQCDPYISSDSSALMRKTILDQINSYYELCCDLISAVQPEGVILNGKYLEKIDEIHESLVSR